MLRQIHSVARNFGSQRFASTLVVANTDNGVLNSGALHAVTAAKAVGGDIHVLVAGSNTKDAAAAAAAIDGVSKVLHCEDAKYDHEVAEQFAPLIASATQSGGYTHVFGSASASNKNAFPRAAATLDVQPISEIVAVDSEDTFTRPIYAGNALGKYKSADSVKMVTVRTTNFDAAPAEGGSASIEAQAAADSNGPSVAWKEDRVSKSDRPELTSAPVVISGGRGMKNGENFEMLYTMADKLKGAVGASRAAVDAGFVPNELQVGQTGKVVAPSLYVAVGISGAIQHLAGMKDSKNIVAINKDPEAPIFQVADYGLVADLFKAVPEMTEKL